MKDDDNFYEPGFLNEQAILNASPDAWSVSRYLDDQAVFNINPNVSRSLTYLDDQAIIVNEE